MNESEYEREEEKTRIWNKYTKTIKMYNLHLKPNKKYSFRKSNSKENQTFRKELGWVFNFLVKLGLRKPRLYIQ